MRFLALARDDLKIVMRDKSAIFWVVIAPFLWIYFFGHLVGGGSDDPNSTRIGLTVIQKDSSEMAGRFIELLEAENFSVTVAGQAPDAGEEEGPVRTLVIPESFGQAIADRQEVTLEIEEKDGASPDGTLAAQVAVHKATVRLLAGEAFGELKPEEDRVLIRSSWAGAKKIPSGLYQTVPGYLVMFVTLSSFTFGAAGLAKDRKSGLLSRIAVSPLTRAQIIAGKICGRAAIALAQALVLIVAGLTVFRIDWGSSPAGLIAVLLTLILCAAGMSLLSGTLFKSPDAAAGVGVVLALIMSALGGCWWPAEVMPSWLRTASHVFPTAWAMDGLHQIISWNGGLADVLLPSGVLLLFGLATGALAVRRIQFAP